MVDEPMRLVWQGQGLELEAENMPQVRRQLAYQIRRKVWGQPKGRFIAAQSRWQSYARPPNTVRWIFEAIGDADLPPESEMANLSRQMRRLDQQLAPATVFRFTRNFPAWNKKSTKFCARMARYCNRFEIGGGRVVRGLELTRDTSFNALEIMALFASGGSSAALTSSVSAAARLAARRVLVREAAMNFVLRGIEDNCTNLGNVLSGQPITGDVVARQMVTNALMVAPDMALGGIMGHIIGPLTRELVGQVARLIARGDLVSQIAGDAAQAHIEDAVQEVVERFITQSPNDIRHMLDEALQESSAQAAGRRGADNLLRNRRFRRALEAGLAA